MKIIALPFAGGTKYSYRELEKYVPKEYQWINIELPGRGTRIQHDLNSNFIEVLDDIYNQIKREISASGYILFGHSMGALLSYELTKKIIEKKQNKPKLLFLTGRGAPSTNYTDKISQYNKDKFWKEIKNIGGMPDSMINSNEFREFVEPVLRNDFHMVESYSYLPLEKPIEVPLFIRVGEDEEEITHVTAPEWQKETCFPIDLKKRKGGHFFIFDSPKDTIDDIVNADFKIQLYR